MYPSAISRILLLSVASLLFSVCTEAGNTECRFLRTELTDGKLLLHIPNRMLGKDILFGSRIANVNHPSGKVYANGQMKEQPVMVRFVKKEGKILLEKIDIVKTNDDNSYLFYRNRIKPGIEKSFDTFSCNSDETAIDVTGYFSKEIPLVWLIPKKEVKGNLDMTKSGIVSTGTYDDYVKITSRYRYKDTENPLDATIQYFFLSTPEIPLETRMSDESVEYKSVLYDSYSDKNLSEKNGKVEYICRWRIEKGTEIIFYVDKAFPTEWFPYIKEGIEDWNKAFRHIGFGDVLKVKEIPSDSTFDPYGPKTNMVRYLDVDEANAKGQFYCDPRSGEILQGDILWWKNVLRLMKDWRFIQTAAADPSARGVDYPIEILGPMIRHAISHEMGHVLGLGHNMGASFAYPSDSLRSVSFTREFGTAASVMDYARYNHLAEAEDVLAGIGMLPPRIGPYDEYAIGYGYSHSLQDYLDNMADRKYCFCSPFISAAISPDPSSQAETLGDDLLYSSAKGLENCIMLMDSVERWTAHPEETARRKALIRKQYFRYISLSLSNIGGAVHQTPVPLKIQKQTVRFVLSNTYLAQEALHTDDDEDNGTIRKDQVKIINDLLGNFLPERVLDLRGYLKEISTFVWKEIPYGTDSDIIIREAYLLGLKELAKRKAVAAKLLEREQKMLSRKSADNDIFNHYIKILDE